MKDKFTPNYIESLEDNEVFVFGSNLDGYHIGGAAMKVLDGFYKGQYDLKTLNYM